MMNLIAEWVRQNSILDMEALQFDNTDILRFCRARKFNEAKIKTMIQNFAEWRQQEEVETILETWDFPELEQIRVAMPQGLHKNDKLGRPIYIRKLGVTDFDAFFASATNERLSRHVIYQLEDFKYRLYPVSKRVYNRHVESNCQIFDIEQGSVRKMMSK